MAFCRPKRFLLSPAILGLAGILSRPVVGQADGPRVRIRFEAHHWAPLTVGVPAGQPVTIEVVNASEETIEFESFKLNREKAIPRGETATVHLPALSPGSYDFYDDFHQDVPEGSILAK
jgi:Cupredoxin-like domain